MNRRDFLKSLALTSPIVCSGCAFIHHLKSHKPQVDLVEDLSTAPIKKTELKTDKSTEYKSVHFDSVYSDDIFWPEEERALLESLLIKFNQIQSYVGHGHFNLLGMDEFFLYAERAPGVEAVTSKEKVFLDELFHYDSTKLGFFGEKVFHSFTSQIKNSEVQKISYTGHYLRRGRAIEMYDRMVKDVGSSLILTSGVRGLAKQFHLFLQKAAVAEWNFSLASRSLAPPGYSFHGQNDFDIGRKGGGLANFSDSFSQTEEFKKLIDLGYVDIRYQHMNQLGVRFEPWHIKV